MGLRKVVRWLAVAPVALWRWGISPLLAPSCRYQPSCSAYVTQSVLRHGLWAGGWLSLFRLLRCAPWGGSGSDPVPRKLHRPFYDLTQYWNPSR